VGSDTPKARLRDYFVRHIALLEDTLERFRQVEGMSDEAALDYLRSALDAFEKQEAPFTREFHLLRREWDAAGVPEGDRQAVRALARRAAQCAQALTDHMQKVQQTLGVQQDELAKSLNRLRAGRDLLGKYGIRRQDDAGTMDKKV
jgi:alkylhydroperoxidase family enzyme